MTQWTPVDTDHHQFALGSHDADTLDVRYSGQLIQAGPGFATLLTGTAYGPVDVELTVLEAEPTTTENAEWETVEEAPLRLDSPAQLVRLDGEPVDDCAVIPAGRYRIRAHARGRDIAWDQEVTEPVEQHLIWLWPDTSRRRLRQLKKTDQAWDEFDDELRPDRSNVVFIDPDGTLRKVDSGSWEVGQAHANAPAWGGREPSEKIRLCEPSRTIATVDRRLLDVFETADDATLREITGWAARRACARAEIDQIDWVAELLLRIDDGVAAFDYTKVSLHGRLWRDTRISRRIVHGRHLYTDFVEQDQAITTICSTLYDDQLVQALSTLRAALGTYGLDYRDLVEQFLEHFAGEAPAGVRR